MSSLCNFSNLNSVLPKSYVFVVQKKIWRCCLQNVLHNCLHKNKLHYVFLKYNRFTFTWLSCLLVNLMRVLFLLWFSSFETECTVTFVKSNFKIFSWDLLMIETAKFQIQIQFHYVLFCKNVCTHLHKDNTNTVTTYFVCGIWNLFMLSQNYLMITSFITNKTCL